MFRSFIKVYADGAKLLVDSKGVTFRRGHAVKTAEVRFYGCPYTKETPASLTELSSLEKELATLYPKANAWLDAGVINKGFTSLVLPEMDMSGRIFREKAQVEKRVHRLEFYHIGE